VELKFTFKAIYYWPKNIWLLGDLINLDKEKDLFGRKDKDSTMAAENKLAKIRDLIHGIKSPFVCNGSFKNPAGAIQIQTNGNHLLHLVLVA
jgi:hypothetical protein